MESMSIDPAAAAIGAQLVELATRALASGAAVLPSLTALAPAGAEEVSMQAVMAFAAEAEAMAALNSAAQEELARAGAAVTDIARMYSQVDGEAAGALLADGSRFAGEAFRGGAGAHAGAGLMQAETLPGAAGAAPRTPLLTNLLQGAQGVQGLPGVAASNPATAVPAAANAASTVLGAGTAPLSSIGSMASAGGGAGPGTASSAVPGGLASSFDKEKDPEEERETAEGEDPGEQRPGERLL